MISRHHAPAREQTGRIPAIDRVVGDVPIEVGVPATEPDRVLGEEAPALAVVVAGAVVVEAALGIELAPRIGEGVGDALEAGLDAAIGVVVVGVDYEACRIGDPADRALVVRLVIEALPAALDGERLIDGLTVAGAGEERIAPIEFEQDIAAVVNVARDRATSRRTTSSPTAPSTTRSWRPPKISTPISSFSARTGPISRTTCSAPTPRASCVTRRARSSWCATDPSLFGPSGPIS